MLGEELVLGIDAVFIVDLGREGRRIGRGGRFAISQCPNDDGVVGGKRRGKVEGLVDDTCKAGWNLCYVNSKKWREKQQCCMGLIER